MNAIGQFGRFITEYQNPIQIVLIIIVLAGAIYAAVKAVAHGREKKGHPITDQRNGYRNQHSSK